MRSIQRLMAAVALAAAVSVPAGAAFGSTTVTKNYTTDVNVNLCNGEHLHFKLFVDLVTQEKGGEVTNRLTEHGQGTGNKGMTTWCRSVHSNLRTAIL